MPAIALIKMITILAMISMTTSACDKACKICSEDASECKECKEGYFFKDNNCQMCKTNCKSCSNLEICDECDQGYKSSSKQNCINFSKNDKLTLILMAIFIGALIIIVCSTAILCSIMRKFKEFKEMSSEDQNGVDLHIDTPMPQPEVKRKGKRLMIRMRKYKIKEKKVDEEGDFASTGDSYRHGSND